MVEFIRFLSRVSNKNFLFNEEDLQFTVTIVSEEPTSIDEIMTALVQELRVHDLRLVEQGNNLLIHQNPQVTNLSRVVADTLPGSEKQGKDTELITRVYRLNTLSPEKASILIRPMVSEKGLVDFVEGTNHVVVTDVVNNVDLISQLIKSLDAPNSGMVVGQYVVRSSGIDTLILLAQQIMQPIAIDQPLIFVPHGAANSIFIVSTPFLVERGIAILQHLDQTQGTTRIYNLDDLKFDPTQIPGLGREPDKGRWELGPDGRWIFKSGEGGELIPSGEWYIDKDGNWIFVPEGQLPPPGSYRDLEHRGPGPQGFWRLDKDGNWVYELDPRGSITADEITRKIPSEPDLPIGHIERTKFYISKLQFRKGDEIQRALINIGQSLEQSGQSNEDLIAAINSTQWLETSNSLIFTGTPRSLDKVRELIQEIDVPLRQVFIEMLILETTLEESLNYGVNAASRFSQENLAASQVFQSSASPINASLDGSGLGGGTQTTGNDVTIGDLFIAEQVFDDLGSNLNANARARFNVLNAARLRRPQGFSMGIIGRTLTRAGVPFDTIAALVTALHQKTQSNIVMNPKILCEDNIAAEIFVGINTSFQTNSISNDEGSIVTTNVEFRDIGTTLKVTPHLGHNNIVTLDIEQSSSSVLGGLQDTGNTNSQSAGPTTRQNRTTTRVHIPNEYFLIMSGMMQADQTRFRDQVPCLGGVPFIGSGFSDKQNNDTKQNLMIFIRPQIIDTAEQVNDVTKRQQDVFKYKSESKDMWRYETEEALDFLNLKDPDPCDPCKPLY